MDVDDGDVIPAANPENEEEDEDMDEEDEVDEEEEDDEEEEVADDDVLDGGVAEARAEGAAVRSASAADITLFLVCADDMEIIKDHAILRPGMTVRIGLDKNTKLSAVFGRFVQFCNEHGGSPISVDDLEFVHSQLLKGHDTTEAAALMKNDRILVRKERASDRDMESERQRVQRDADKEYFHQLRQLLPNGTVTNKVCDVVLDCRGNQMDDEGRIQQVLSTTVRCHSALLRKRCPWLGRMIDAASQEQARRSIVSLPDAETASSGVLEQHQVPDDFAKAESKDSEDDDIEMLNYNARVGNREARNDPGVAQIENDEDDNKFNGLEEVAADDDASFSTVRSDSSVLWVTLPNHSPEAVKILLEFVYTNRVIPLGLHAFLHSCRNKPDRKHKGPIAPFPTGSSSARHWPNRGEPTVTFAVAMAALALAEEAVLPRLSLMCEIAASHLVSVNNVVEALALCQTQKEATGNPLDRLRKAAMNIVLRSGPRGVFSLPTFRRALAERGRALIPTLMTGAMEAVDGAAKSKAKKNSGDKRDWQEIALDYFDIVDRDDNSRRERERRKRRMERWESDPARAGEPDSYNEDRMDASDSWSTAAQRRSLKRMSHNMDDAMKSPKQQRRSSSNRRGSGRYYK